MVQATFRRGRARPYEPRASDVTAAAGAAPALSGHAAGAWRVVFPAHALAGFAPAACLRRRPAQGLTGVNRSVIVASTHVYGGNLGSRGGQMRGGTPRPSRQLHKTIGLLRGIRSNSEMLDVALPAVRLLIGADVASSVAVGPGNVVGRPVFEPADAMRRADLGAYTSFRHQQPMIGD